MTNKDLIEEARTAVLNMDYSRAYQGGLVGRLADALEASLRPFDRVEPGELEQPFHSIRAFFLSNTFYQSLEHEERVRRSGDLARKLLSVMVVPPQGAFPMGNLEIVNSWLVERGAHDPEYPAGAAYGAMPYSDAEPLVNLSEVSGWPTVDRDKLEQAVGKGLFNANNHPNPTAVLGRDTSQLRKAIVDSLIEAGVTITPTEENM